MPVNKIERFCSENSYFLFEYLMDEKILTVAYN